MVYLNQWPKGQRLDLGVNLLNIAIGHPKIKFFHRCPKVSPETMYWKSRLCHIHTQTYNV